MKGITPSQEAIFEKTDKNFEFVVKTLRKVSMNDLKAFNAVSKVIAFLTDKQILTMEEITNLTKF